MTGQLKYNTKYNRSMTDLSHVCHLVYFQEISKDVEDHRLQYHSIHDFGDELLRHPKAGDTSFVTAVLANLDQNWTSLEDVLAKR